MASPNGVVYSSVKLPHSTNVFSIKQGVIQQKQGDGYLLVLKPKFFNKGLWPLAGKRKIFIGFRRTYLVCQSTETHSTDTKERVRCYTEFSHLSSPQSESKHPIETDKSTCSSHRLSEACKFVHNDARFMNERARNDIILLSRGILRLDARARQDVAFLGSEFLKLDARAREETEKIDNDVKRRAERLHHIATILKEKAQSRLKKAADKHWSDGALEADLKRADVAAKRRAMEDSLMALELVKNLHDRMVNKMCRVKTDSTNTDEVARYVTLENLRKTLDVISGEVSADRIDAIQEAYWCIASALSEADGIDYTDPEELEFLVATLIDLDAMDGKSSVSLLAECSSSPDVSTRRALANALSAAPSMWTLGNAGMGALQRLAQDPNPAIAAAASKTIYELKKQWEIEEDDTWRYMMSQSLPSEIVDGDIEDDTGTD
ncbi:senescence-associated protein SPA15, chloroplastic isoform X2 [Primulina huaijiensis]|uniref:senescence-associated protein SPA15, chloroplastic isoform X2 n=1 Tax=Primulina huaijiensis TaxID=1492673 RepID=UPI003CC6E24C